MTAKILAFAGSTRTQSWNKRLLKIAADGATETGAEVTVVDLRDFPLPLYDGDLEAADGVPAPALRFRELLLASRGFLIVSPEHNGSVSAVLKNTLDWCSRPVDGQDGLLPYKRKLVALAGTSISPYGAVRAIGHLRSIMSKMGAIVLGEEVTVPFAAQAFGEAGDLVNPALQTLAKQLGANLARTVENLNPVPVS
jgi:NAD(P)H-dependent FMN reductase